MTRILFLMSDTGGGHRASTKAIMESFSLVSQEEKIELEMVDFLAQGIPKPLNKIGTLYGPFVNRMPYMWLLWYRSTAKNMVKKPFEMMLEFAFETWLTDILQRKKYDMVVSLHPLAVEFPANVIAKKFPSIPFCVIVTDLGTAHPLWFASQATRYYVPNEIVKKLAEKQHILKKNIEVHGAPIHPVFSKRYTTEECQDFKKQYGFPLDRPLVLLMGGGEGMDMMIDQAKIMNKCDIPLSLMVITGRNLRLKKRLEALEFKIPIEITGFVNDIPFRMQACDVIVSKAGPGTICEGLAASKPLLISQYIPGQEKANVDFVVENQAGYFTPHPKDIINALHELFDEQGRKTKIYEKYAKNAIKIARPLASFDIVTSLYSLLKK